MPLPNRTPDDNPAEPIFDGGGEEERREILDLYYAFLRANDALDIETLRTLWSPDPSNVYFNTNGYTYHGLEDWTNIWRHYRGRLTLDKPSPSGQIRLTIRDGMALLTDDRLGRFRGYVAGKEEPDIAFNQQPYVRLTNVYLKENGEWRVIHAHFSSGHDGPRPDQR
jgi:SnoaL-like domain